MQKGDASPKTGFSRLRIWARDCLVENIPGAKPTWEFIRTESRGVKQGWVLFTAIGVVVVVVTAFVTHNIDHLAIVSTADRTSQDIQIKQRTLMLAAQIREFIRDWKDSDDETVQRQNVDKYMTRFSHTALAVRDGLDQHGVRSPELDKLMFEFSYSYKDVRAIPAELEKLANATPVPMQFQVTETDPQARADLAIAQSEIARLRATVKTFEDQATEQNAREWPPLSDLQIKEWARVLAPYRGNVEAIVVIWAQDVEAKKLFRSLQSVGRAAGIPFENFGGSADDNGKITVADRNGQLGKAMVELFTKAGYPAVLEIREAYINRVTIYISDRLTPP